MRSKKPSRRAVQSALVIEAHAGLIPESDWIAEEVRARMDRTGRTSRIIKSHARLLTGDSDALAISEILTDMQHYCDSKGLAFEKLVATATEDYEDEVSQSRMMGCLLN
jgi:hypothetical protein